MCEVISEPGIYSDIPAEDYHADPCAEPSLSSSIAKLLLQAPLLAKLAHPRLTINPAKEHKPAFDLGAVCHSVLLGADEDRIEVCDFADWRGKNSAVRKEIWAAGKTPVLTSDFDIACRMADAARAQLDRWDDEGVRRAFQSGKPEQTGIWQDEFGWHRCRFDWLDSELGIVTDYKTTSLQGGAAPGSFHRRAFDMGWDIQMAHYSEGYRAIYGQTPARFQFVVQETKEPYLLTVCQMTASGESRGFAQIDHARRTWRDCLSTGEWPVYPPQMDFIEPTAWQMAEVESRQQLEAS